MYTNSTGQVPQIAGSRQLIDLDTPASALTKIGQDGNEYTLVFSDEFNTDGRTFYDGDDPFWTAGRQHYYGTGDVEFYDPQSATTSGGNLVLNLSYVPDRRTNFNFSYMSAMVTGWNQYVNLQAMRWRKLTFAAQVLLHWRHYRSAGLSAWGDWRNGTLASFLDPG